MYYCLQCKVVHYNISNQVIVFKSGFRYINKVRLPVGLCSFMKVVPPIDNTKFL
ncbi:DUF3973 domain-containing protein [Gordoniibacillus kamchatkensis]|uniref:DUF3973 domain-containing protein n=1 Tax=Gordoniibacillus kamchatkensis TaxID=1590651 RepID=UPI000A7A4715